MITISQDYGAEMIWLKGTDNAGSEAMTRLPTLSQVPTKESTFEEKEAYFQQQLFKTDKIFPMDRKYIAQKQKDDPGLATMKMHRIQGKRFGSKTKRGVKLTTFDGKIWVPDELTEGIVEWYHENLEHPGREGMINAVSKNFKWKGLTAQIEKL
eukprot:9523671-Ditylum_brightwellii.AAC.1